MTANKSLAPLTQVCHDDGMEATYTAKRIGSIVVIERDGVEINRAGGKRAERAAAVILTAWDGRDFGLWGLRSDALAATSEAARLTVATATKRAADAAIVIMVEG